MSANAKKPITERERRRLRANQMSKAIISEKNENTQTNMTYRKIMGEIEFDKKSSNKSPTRSLEKTPDGKFIEPLSGADISDTELPRVHIEDEEDESTGASQDSDTSSQKSDVQREEETQQKLLLSGSGNFIKWWNNFVIVLAMYNSLLIPLDIFYSEKSHSYLQGSVISFIDACVDFFFLVDIIIRFRTTFLDPKQSIEVKDPHVIGIKYLKGAFTIDFISSVPFTSFTSSSGGVTTTILDGLGLLKLLRLGRLYSTVQRSNMPQEIKVYLKILMMAIFLFVTIHVLSCIWFAVVSGKERWVQNMDFMYLAQEQAYQGFHEGDDAFWQKYFVLLYTGFYIFGVGEVVPRAGSFEFFSGFILCSLCTIFNALIIGYMTSYMEELNKKSAELAEKLNLANTAMLNLNLSRNLKSQITQYIYQTHTTKQLQSELTNFMTQISPIYKRKVTKESFKNLVKLNRVLKTILKQHIEAKLNSLSTKVPPANMRSHEQKETDKCITQLVVKLESIFTSPDIAYLQQEDEATKNPNTELEDGEEPEEEIESFMYFIRNGKFSVHVKTDHLRPAIIDEAHMPAPVTHLIDGDHFGEIGMIFDCKRTATVKSENYGTLALLKKSHFTELSKTFESLTYLFKRQIFKYQDEVTMWLMAEMDKIEYFRNLSLTTKQELIYGMERFTFEKGSLICKKDEAADKMFLIQQGIVEVAVKYDRRREDQYFVIERLGRGSIINHRSFMINDDADTDFVCRTNISCFALTNTKLKEVTRKRQDLQQARTIVKKELLEPLAPIALDYIFHNNNTESVENYQQTLRKNQLRVKFKNAIMQMWTKVKEETAPGNIQDMIDQMLKKKRASAKDGLDFQTQQQQQEELLKKMERRKERAARKQERLELESKDSYLNLEQFSFLQKNIEMAGKRLKEQQSYIDLMEKKMITQLDIRRKKEEEQAEGASNKTNNHLRLID